MSERDDSTVSADFEPPSQPPPPRSGSSTREPASSSTRWFMNVMLWSCGVLSVPLLVLVYLMTAALGTGVAALALSKTGGFVSATFGGGFAISAMVGGLAVCTGLFARFKWRHDNTKSLLRMLAQPSLALLLAFFLPASLMTVLEMVEVDIPDMVSTATLLGSVFYLWFVLPFALGRGSWKLLRFLQRWGAEGQARAARLAISAPIGLLVGASLLVSPLVVSFGESDHSPAFSMAAITNSEGADIESSGVVEGTRQVLAGFAEETREENKSSLMELAGAGGDAAAGARIEGVRRKRSNDCFSILLTAGTDGKSEVDRQRERARKKLGDSSAAHDVAHEALAKTCGRHSEEALKGELVRYYNTVVGNEINNYYRDRKGWTRFADAVDWGWLPSSRSDFFVKEAFEQCMDELEPEEEALLRVFYIETDRDYGEVRRRFDLSYSYARKKVQLARDAVKAHCQKYWN